MREVTVCEICGSSNITYLDGNKCICNICNKTRKPVTKMVMSPYERTRAQVYATENKWAIENFNATH